MGNFSLGVNHGNTTHRLVRALAFELKADGTVIAEAAGSRAGARRWLVPDTAKLVSLSIKLAWPTDPAKLLVDSLQLFVTAGGPPPLLVATGGTHVAPFEPRLSPVAIAAGGKTGAVFLFDLDVNFIDVTDYAASLTPPATFAPTNGSRFALLEYTGASGPACWPVFLPPSLPAVATPHRVSVLLFLRPSPRQNYTNTDDLVTATRDTLKDLMTRYFTDQASVPPNNMFNGSDFPSYGNMGWERQLAASGKAVAMAFPLPHANTNPYGDAVSARAGALLPSLLAALWDSRRIGGDGGPIAINRRAIAGYSNGGRMTLVALGQRENRAAFDEAWLFDPAGFPGLTADLKTWFDLGGKTLRMIGGGFQHGAMMGFLGKLSGATATVWPPALDFWYTAAEYRRGISSAAGPSETLTPLGSAPAAGSASARSGVFLDSFTLDPVNPIASSRLDVATAGKAQTRTYVGFRHLVAPDPRDHGHVVPAPEEVAAVLAGHSIAAKAGGSPVTAGNFAATVENVIENEDASERDRIAAVRHEWTAFGGIILDPQVGYKGFFEHCLANSSL